VCVDLCRCLIHFTYGVWCLLIKKTGCTISKLRYKMLIQCTFHASKVQFSTTLHCQRGAKVELITKAILKNMFSKIAFRLLVKNNEMTVMLFCFFSCPVNLRAIPTKTLLESSSHYESSNTRKSMLLNRAMLRSSHHPLSLQNPRRTTNVGASLLSSPCSLFLSSHKADKWGP
jgi:hypothetical protein